jgi:hypothetical protein
MSTYGKIMEVEIEVDGCNCDPDCNFFIDGEDGAYCTLFQQKLDYRGSDVFDEFENEDRVRCDACLAYFPLPKKGE